MNKNLKEFRLFYIGQLKKTSNSYKRFEVLRRITSVVGFLDTDKYIYNSITRPLDYHFNIGLGVLVLNIKLMLINVNEFNLLLIDNRSYIMGTTVRFLKKRNANLIVIFLLTDDPFGKYRRGWRLFKSTLYLSNAVFVQRKPNISELSSLGARNVQICYRSYDLDFHRRKINIKKNEAFDVQFIGSYEEEREESICYLISHGIKVGVRGDGWTSGVYFDVIRPYYLGPSVYGEDYIDCINSMKVALHFLRKGNRDEQDSRTFEIPACGVPMIAEYSAIHAELFTEDTEVLFFRSNLELLQKVLYGMENPEMLQKISEKAHLRCMESGYDHESTLRRMLSNAIF